MNEGTRIARSAYEKLMLLEGDAFWNEFYSYRASDLHSKTPIPLDGPMVPGGGSKSGKRKKSPKGNKVYIDQWSGI